MILRNLFEPPDPEIGKAWIEAAKKCFGPHASAPPSTPSAATVSEPSAAPTAPPAVSLEPADALPSGGSPYTPVDPGLDGRDALSIVRAALCDRAAPIIVGDR